MPDIFEEASVERLVTGGTYVLVFGLLTGLLGWMFMSIASRSDVGVGGEYLGFITAATSLHVIAMCISGGFHQGLSKYLSEALVESKEKALKYAKSAFFIFNISGLILFIIFLIVSITLFPYNLGYGIVFGVMAVAYYLTFFRDNFMGNLASVHRFDYIGKLNFLSGIAGIAIGCVILFLVPFPTNALLLPLLIIVSLIVSIILLFYYGRKVIPYSLTEVFKGANRKEVIELAKYMLYCTIPNIIFSGAILWIQNLWYSGFFSFKTILVSANGLIIGYSGIVFAICQFGWPQIPAVSEAKAKNNHDLINDYMKNTLHTGFNITAFFLIIYIGLSYQLLYLFHGSEYLIALSPFIILSTAVAILGIEFLICTLLIGLGEGKKAAYLILTLTLVQLILVPILIMMLIGVFGPVAPETLYAGPVSLLVSSVVVFPFTFHYLKKFTNNPVRDYTSILAKGTVSIIITLIFYAILDITVFPDTAFQIGLIVRGIVLFGLFTICMLIFAGYKDKDLEFYEKIPFFKPILNGMKWILHHSPFYKQEEV